MTARYNGYYYATESIKEGEEKERNWLLAEVEELIAITSRMMLNKLK